MKERLLISACLLGEPCRYDAGSREYGMTVALSEKYEFVPVCPEQLGGLPTPRAPAEIRGGAVIAKDGVDVTEKFRAGAEAALEAALTHGCKKALLKEKSPSCGKGRVYDGTFTGTLVSGNGVTAALLAEHGIAVYGESETELLK